MWRLVAAVVLCGACAAGAGGRGVEVGVAAVRIDPDTAAPVVELVEKGGLHRTLPIVVGLSEAQAIAVELDGVAAPRPMPHDLMKRLVEGLGGRLRRVELAGRDDDVVLALLHLDAADGRALEVDARPSDAIALAVRLRRPIVVAPHVFPRAELRDGGRLARVWGATVQALTPELAGLVGVAEDRGALVSDVDPAGAGGRLRRGDVIVGVDGRPVTSPLELAALAEARDDGRPPAQLAVRRGERLLQVRLRGEPTGR